MASGRATAAGIAGLALHLLTGIFPYAASGLVSPLYGYVILYALWVLLLVVAVRLYRSRRRPWALLVPVASMLVWLAVLSLGGALLDWTA